MNIINQPTKQHKKRHVLTIREQLYKLYNIKAHLLRWKTYNDIHFFEIVIIIVLGQYLKFFFLYISTETHVYDMTLTHLYFLAAYMSNNG